MALIEEFHGCSLEVSKNMACGIKQVCDICKLCPKHCLEHYQNRYGFRMVKTSGVVMSDFKVRADEIAA